MEIGDYCLGTKFSDGEAWDHWGVGFFSGMAWGRYLLQDAAGKPIRASGFARCEPITRDQGAYLLEHAAELEKTGARLWDYVHDAPKTDLRALLKELDAQKPICRQWLYDVIRKASKYGDFEVSDGHQALHRQSGHIVADILNLLLKEHQ